MEKRDRGGERRPPERGWRRYARLLGLDWRAEIEEEIAFHLEARVADLMDDGMDEAEAREAATQAFGDVGRVRRELSGIGRRRARRRRWVRRFADMASDIRFGLRMLRREPVYAVAMLATLALVVAATTTIFSLVNGVLLRPLPYPEPDELAVVWERNTARGRGENVASVANFQAWRLGAESFESLAGIVPNRVTLAADRPERIEGAAVSASWFDVIGVEPAVGRAFTDAEARSESRVVVLGDGLWRTRFGADPDVVGGTVRMNGEPYTVTGVMPPGFEPPAFGWITAGQRYWVPFTPTATNRRWGRFLLVVGRLRDGATVARADEELKAIAARRVAEEGADREWTADAVGLHAQVTDDVRAQLLVLAGAVAFLLTIGIVNVTTLVLARAQRRGSEFALRSALGARRGRLVGQLFAEGVAIAVAATPFGALLAFGGVRTLAAALPPGLSRGGNVRLDVTTLAACAAAVLLAVIVIGLVPALRRPRDDVRGGLRGGAGGRVVEAAGGRHLVVAEVAIALVLSVGAGLAMRSFVNLRSVPLGFEAEDVVAFRLDLGGDAYDDDRRRVFFDELLTRLRGVSGVEAAAAVSARPLGGWGPATRVRPLTGSIAEADAPVADVRMATPGYFDVLRIRGVLGDGFDEPVRPDGPRRVVVNRTMARRLWPGRDPTGERVVVAFDPPDTVEVVGVVDDVRLIGPATSIRSTVYYPYALWPNPMMDVVVRSALPAERVVPVLRDVVWEIDPSLAVFDVAPLERLVADATAQERISFLLLGGFSVLALLLAATGVYGVLALEVGSRRGELAVRLALGAPPARIRRGVVGSALRVASLGGAIGVVGALVLTRFMGSVLYGVTPTDPPTYGITAAVLVAITFVASYLPARRASRVDPLHSVRAE